jgi:acyl-coenzyme A thioesterase PaaI-like protein
MSRPKGNAVSEETKDRPWLPPPPGRLLGRGHPAGDFLEAYEWSVLVHEPGRYVIEAHLPEHVKNPRGQLFGGFTPTYVDLLAVRTAHSHVGGAARGMATVNMRLDYFEPVTEARFMLESRVVNSRGRNHLVEVLLKDLAGKLLAFSIVTLRQR